MKNTEARGARLRHGLETVTDRISTVKAVRGPGPTPATDVVIKDGSPASQTATPVQRSVVGEGLRTWAICGCCTTGTA